MHRLAPLNDAADRRCKVIENGDIHEDQALDVPARDGRLTALMSAAAAHAFSDDAVKDAQKLLEITATRYAYGEVTDADLALARYNLLDLRQKARQVARDAFCQAAKSELLVVAAEYEEPDGHAGEKAKWQGEITGMTTSPAACDRAVATAGALLFGYAERIYSPDDVKSAEDEAQAADERYRFQEITRGDLLQAQFGVLAARYGAKLIALQAYCDQGLPALRTIADTTVEESKVGQAALSDVMGARRAIYRLRAACGSK